MTQSDSDQIKKGPELDKLRALHPAFLAERLEFRSDLSVTRKDVVDAYAKWRSIKNWSPPDVNNLYALIRFMGVVEDERTKTFHGVGLRS